MCVSIWHHSKHRHPLDRTRLLGQWHANISKQVHIYCKKRLVTINMVIKSGIPQSKLAYRLSQQVLRRDFPGRQVSGLPILGACTAHHQRWGCSHCALLGCLIWSTSDAF